MAGNPYYVKPFTPDLSPILDGIGGLIKQNREEKQKKQEVDEIMKAVNSNDPDQVADLMIRYPGRAKEIQTGFDMKKGVTEPIVMNAYQKAIADPANAQAYLDEASDEVEKLGRNPVNLREDADMFMENPEGAMQNVKVTYAGLDPKGYKAFQEQQGGSDPDLPSSVREWQYYDNLPEEDQARYREMKRQGNKIQTIGSIPTMVDLNRGGQQTPLSTIEDEATGKAKIASEKSRKLAETKAKTEARIGYAKGKMQFDQNIEIIDKLKKHPGKDISFGITGQFPSYPGSDASNFEAMKKQLSNKVFITNREALKGGGSITDFEGTKAEEAELRVSNAQSVEAFNEALDDYEYWVKRGFDNMKRAAKGDFSIEEIPEERQEKQNNSGNIDDLVNKYAQ